MRRSLKFFLTLLAFTALTMSCVTTAPPKAAPNLVLDLRSAPVPVMLNEGAPTVGITAEFSSGEGISVSTGYGTAYVRNSNGSTSSTTVTTTTVSVSDINTPIANQMQMAWITGPTALWLSKIGYSYVQEPGKSATLLTVKAVVTK